MITKRQSFANNKYMTNYNSQEPYEYLAYFDMNNLYGFAMSQMLLHSDFRWLNNKEVRNPLNVDEYQEIGYILEVDL